MSVVNFYKQGQMLTRRGKYGEAIECFEKALAVNPKDTNAIFALGNVAKKMGLPDVAEKMFRATLALLPDSMEAASNLGTLLIDLDRIDEAIEIYQGLLATHPENAEIWLNIGIAVKKSGDLEKAEIFTRESLRLKPKYAVAYVSLSEILFSQNDLAGAMEAIDKAWRLDKKNGRIRYNRSEFLLASGALEEGWREMDYGLQRYEGRVTHYHHKLKRWNGENLEGKSILLSGEQGMADQIRYINCIPDILEKAAHVVIETEPRLVTLMARTFPEAEVYPIDCSKITDTWNFNYDWPVNKLDYASPMLNLFRFFRNEITDFPSPSVTIVTDPDEQAKWHKRVADKAKGLKIGLCWRSGISTIARDISSIDLLAMAPILGLKGVSFFNLMYSDCKEERDTVKDQLGVDIITFDDLDYKNDMEAIFALSNEMDIMVSNTSAPFCITAALGIPTYLMMPFTGWQSLGTDYMPIEPSATPYTQQTAGDWSDVVEKIAARINKDWL